jgi:hypothetical protein
MTLRGLSQKSTHSGSCICDNYPIVNFIFILKNTKSTKTRLKRHADNFFLKTQLVTATLAF